MADEQTCEVGVNISATGTYNYVWSYFLNATFRKRNYLYDVQ
jgi:hypothetical protein